VFWFVPVPYTRIVNPWKVIRLHGQCNEELLMRNVCSPAGAGIANLQWELKWPLVRCALATPRRKKRNGCEIDTSNETRPSGKLGRAGTENTKSLSWNQRR
jgi:hypothetical protein